MSSTSWVWNMAGNILACLVATIVCVLGIWGAAYAASLTLH